MSTSTRGGPEPFINELYPSSLLKSLLKQMMAQFAAQGACIALYDERTGHMRIQAHLRSRSTPRGSGAEGIRPVRRRMTVHLENNVNQPSTNTGRLRNNAFQSLDDVDEISPQQSELFAANTTYPIGHDLIGFTWQKNDAYVMSHDDYLSLFHDGETFPYKTDILPTCYLSVPIREALLPDDLQESIQQTNILGVIVLYQVQPGLGTMFQQRQRLEALQAVERIALYLQNYQLQHGQRRSSEYLQQLQEISTVFPTSVQLSDLIENMHRFVKQVVDASSILLTLYDRDTERIYDVFALNNGMRMDDLVEQATGHVKEERPTWWQVVQQEKKTLAFSPAQEPHKMAFYSELLGGAWGDQRQAESFLLLPMKIFNRVIGSLSIASKHPNAYHPEEIQVLETMIQIVTVGVENVKLYQRDRSLLQETNKLLQDTRQSEMRLAAVNSALQSIGSVLHVNALLNNFVNSVASLINVELCVFFQPSKDQRELVAQAIYSPSSFSQADDDSDLPAIMPPTSEETENALISMIRLPFKTTILEQHISENFFYLDAQSLEELAQSCGEGGALFLEALSETEMQQMLMITMSYQGEFMGLLAVPAPREHHGFHPREVGTLLAICAQATSALRNAQLFEQREMAYAELQRMDRLKDEFLVTASHELRTPLSAIKGYASLLQRQSARATPQHVLRYSTKIAQASQQLNDLVSNMTEAAQIGAVDKKMQIEPVHVLSAAEMAKNLLSLNNEQDVSLKVPGTLWVNGDAVCFRQVLTNLLENAAKYSPPDTQITLSATSALLKDVKNTLPEDQARTVHTERDDLRVVLIRVKDQGEGILPEDQKKIFEKFVRAPRSLTTPVRGSGLGLYICRRFVESMNGRIWLEESIPNQGSTFTLYLPEVEPPAEIGAQDTGEYKFSQDFSR